MSAIIRFWYRTGRTIPPFSAKITFSGVGDQRQLFFPVVLPHGKILPEGVRCLINNLTEHIFTVYLGEAVLLVLRNMSLLRG